jgi:hypothetical protein
MIKFGQIRKPRAAKILDKKILTFFRAGPMALGGAEGPSEGLACLISRSPNFP